MTRSLCAGAALLLLLFAPAAARGEDLNRTFNFRLKAGLAEKDPVLRAHRLLCLETWCRGNGMEKKLGRVEKDLRSAWKKIGRGVPDRSVHHDRRDAKRQILAALEGNEATGEVLVATSRRLTIASNHLSEAALENLLRIGELVYDDVSILMGDGTAPDARPLPDGELLRIVSLSRLEAFEAALKRTAEFSDYGTMDEYERDRALRLGGYRLATTMNDHPHITYMNCLEMGTVGGRTTVRTNELRDLVVHQMSHALLANWLPPLTDFDLEIMPWLDEGLAVYMTIKHLGTKSYGCTDFDFEEVGFVKKKKKKVRVKKTGAAARAHCVALSDDAGRFGDMVRISSFSNLKPVVLARAFSMIDFMIERNRRGFLLFLTGLQSLTQKLIDSGDFEAFRKGVDTLIASGFPGGPKGKPAPIVDAPGLEAAWRAWAEEMVL